MALHRSFAAEFQRSSGSSMDLRSITGAVETHKSISSEMFLNEKMSDVTIYVGRDKEHATRFPAHKLILSYLSPVFETMFQDGYLEGKSGEVLITDVSQTAFKALLLFAYTGRIQNHTVGELSNIVDVAQKYLIDKLKTACLQQLKNKPVNDDNIWDFLHFISKDEHLNLNEIYFSVHRYCDSNAENLLQHGEFCNLPASCVRGIISGPELKTSEIVVFNAVVEWAKMECCRQRLEISAEHQRKVLGDILYMIRYLTMNLIQLENGPIKSGILTSEECELLSTEYREKKKNLPPPWDNFTISVARTNRATQHMGF